MKPLSRRRALQLGVVGAGVALTGGGGLVWALNAPPNPVGGAELIEPVVLRSSGGALTVRLEAVQAQVGLAGRQVSTLGYNGSVPGPTLQVRPGDRLQVELVNRLTQPTNLHVHGLHVSPAGTSDNPFITVEPGQSFHYDYHLPTDHPSGLFWYHPHYHGTVAEQVFGGLYGAILVGETQPLPVSRERVLVISDISLDSSGHVQAPSTMELMMGRQGRLLLVNGQSAPQLQAQSGSRERWRVVNACTSRYLRLQLDGQHLQLLGMDGHRFAAPQQVREVVLLPGNRADLLITAAAGRSALVTVPYDRGGVAMMGTSGSSNSNQPTGVAIVLATLDVSGAAAEPPPPLTHPAPRDLRGAAVTAHRTLTLAAGMAGGMGMAGGGGGMRFTIDGREFDGTRVDQTARIGAIEQWTIFNTSSMDHPFHLHVWPMQITQRSGQPIDAATWQDVVNIPARSNVTVLIAFDDFPGRTVYHCHILDHEDHGMMGTVLAQ